MGLDASLKAVGEIPAWDEMLLRAGLQRLSEGERTMTPEEHVVFLALCQRQQHQRMERIIVRPQSEQGATCFSPDEVKQA